MGYTVVGIVLVQDEDIEDNMNLRNSSPLESSPGLKRRVTRTYTNSRRNGGGSKVSQKIMLQSGAGGSVSGPEARGKVLPFRFTVRFQIW